MSKILICGDSHYRHSVIQQTIDLVKPDYTIFLSDWFDNWNDGPEDAKKAALWVKNRIENYPNDLFCYGNHDLGPAFPKTYARACSGFSDTKSTAINKILKPKHWNRFKLFHYLSQGDFLISHAGFSQGILSDFVLNDIDRLQTCCDMAIQGLHDNQFNELFGAGYDRDGGQRIGGPIWCDWRSFKPLSKYNQIVGHTIVDKPKIKYYDGEELVNKYFNSGIISDNNPNKPANYSVCLDTNSKDYAIITDGILTAHETPKEFFKEYDKEQAFRRNASLFSLYDSMIKEGKRI